MNHPDPALEPCELAHDRFERQTFARLYPQLRRFAAAAAAVDIDPDDLVQTALAQALSGGPLSRFDSPEAYLRRAIVNLASNERRRLGRRRRTMARYTTGWSEHTADTYPSDLTELSSLSPSTRALLYLREVEGRGYDEIATMLGVTAASARATASRALRRLRAENHGEQNFDAKPERNTQ